MNEQVMWRTIGLVYALGRQSPIWIRRTHVASRSGPAVSTRQRTQNLWPAYCSTSIQATAGVRQSQKKSASDWLYWLPEHGICPSPRSHKSSTQNPISWAPAYKSQVENLNMVNTISYKPAGVSPTREHGRVTACLGAVAMAAVRHGRVSSGSFSDSPADPQAPLPP